MELDIYIPSIRLGIEFDGANWHNSTTQLEREEKKYYHLFPAIRKPDCSITKGRMALSCARGGCHAQIFSRMRL